MRTEFQPGAPFLPSCEQIGESKFRDVFAFTDQQLVVKTGKPGNQPYLFDTLDDVKQNIQERKDNYAVAMGLAHELGLSQLMMPESAYVIHAGTNGQYTFSEVQPLVKNASSLMDQDIEITELPDHTLVQLRDVFALNKAMHERYEMTVDISGSHPGSDSIKDRVWGALFPLKRSSNIVIDETDTAHFIDFSVLKKTKPRVRRLITHYLGSYVTNVLINRELHKRQIIH